MNSIKTKMINDFRIKKVRLPQLSQKKIRGSEILPIYSNVFICAKKNSGKSTCIFNMLKKCVDKDTILDFFVSTINKERTWKAIVEYFTNKGCTVNSHMSTMGDNGEDLIGEIIDTPVEWTDDEESSSSEEEDLKYISIDNPNKKEQESTPKKRRKKKKAQKRVIVLDDLSSELKKPSIDRLLKINRHLGSKVILSSQYLNDLSPQARRQVDVWMLFPGLKQNKLSQVLRDCDSRLDYPEFEEVYRFCTNKKYNFMTLYCDDDSYRKNFDQKILIDE
jgi:hypothetical protein